MSKTDDKKVWAIYARGVKPITKPNSIFVQKKEPPPEAPAAQETKAAHKQKEKRAPPKKQDADSRPSAHASLDRRLERQLKQGDIEIDARLDLHGMRQQEAHDALNDFIARHVRARDRHLLIITGKGRGGEGVLRTNLAGWLAASLHAAKILALRPAAIRHGGAGAFYVILRKPTK